MKTTTATTLTERGQTSVPAEIRRAMDLHEGQQLVWEKISATECRVRVRPRKGNPPDPMQALGFAKRHLKAPHKTTAEWMRALRDGERA